MLELNVKLKILNSLVILYTTLPSVENFVTNNLITNI